MKERKMIYDVIEMQKNSIGVLYHYKEHNFVNTQLSCGCIIATLIDIKLSREEEDKINEILMKINNCKTFLRVNFLEKESIEYFTHELLEAQKAARIFINQKRQEYDINCLDCNGETFFIKIYKNPSCNGVL
jgi:hypothetical protein